MEAIQQESSRICMVSQVSPQSNNDTRLSPKLSLLNCQVPLDVHVQFNQTQPFQESVENQPEPSKAGQRTQHFKAERLSNAQEWYPALVLQERVLNHSSQMTTRPKVWSLSFEAGCEVRLARSTAKKLFCLNYSLNLCVKKWVIICINKHVTL